MLEHMVLSTGKHGRVARGVALASDMTMREGRRCQRVGVMSKFFFFFFHNSHRCGANSSQFTPTRAVSGETSRFKSKFKKKKKQKNKTEENKRCEKHRLAKINKKGANAPFGQKPYISVHSYLYLSSHL